MRKRKKGNLVESRGVPATSLTQRPAAIAKTTGLFVAEPVSLFVGREKKLEAARKAIAARDLLVVVED